MHVRSLLVFARDAAVVDDLVRGFEHILEVERVPWRAPWSSLLGDPMARVPVARTVGRVAARGVARVLAARAWVKAADRAPALRGRTDQIALFTAPDQVGLADAIDAPRFYHATDDWALARFPQRTLASERRLVASCARVFAGSESLARTLRDRHALATHRVVVVEHGAPVERARTMLAAMHEVA